METTTAGLETKSSRIRWLIGVHLLLAAAPLLGIRLGLSMVMMPIEWTLTSLPLGVLLSLSLWMGFGRKRLLWRIALGLVGVFYLTTFSFINHSWQMTTAFSTSDWITFYLESVWEYAVLLFMLAGTFFLIGRRFEIVQDARLVRDDKLRFSMFQVMALMSAVAIVLSLVRLTRAATGHESNSWETITIYAFMFVMFFVNTACATLAVLGSGKVKRNVAMLLVVTVLLGIALAIAMRQELTEWWLFFGSMLIVIVPTLVVLASLAVVRSCGYRLVRRVRAVSVEPG